MTIIKTFLFILSVVCLFNLISTQISNVTTCEVEMDSSNCGSSKANDNEILKLRLENLELKQSLNFEKINRKLQHLDEHLEKLHGSVVTIPKVEEYVAVPFNGDEEPKICVTNADQSLKCSDITWPNSCADSNSINCRNNKCRIQNRLYGPKTFLISCEDSLNESGWTTIQRRVNGSVDFHHLWSEYKHGFGDLDGNYWIGLEKLHSLTATWAPVELLVILIDFNDVMKYAKYDNFAIGDECSKYVMKNLGNYSGTAGDSLSSHKGMAFTTIDRDNDTFENVNCARRKRGGWWYRSCFTCNLNGRYFEAGTQPKVGDHDGISWKDFHGVDYSLKFAQMMIKPKRQCK